MVIKKVFTFIFLLNIIQAVGQDVELISSRNAPSDLDDHTLLVLKFEEKDTTDFEFKSKHLVDNKQTQKFIDKENKKIVKLNKLLYKEFRKYNYKYLMINESQLESFSAEKYPYTFENYLVKRVGKKAKAHAIVNFYTHGFYLYNRRTKKPYADINMFSQNIFREIKIIIRALNYYLEPDQY